MVDYNFACASIACLWWHAGRNDFAKQINFDIRLLAGPDQV